MRRVGSLFSCSRVVRSSRIGRAPLAGQQYKPRSYTFVPRRSFAEEPATQAPELRDTEVLLDLLRFPPNERADSWTHRFYDALGTASLKGDIEPQVITGPDSMIYFRLALPHYGEPFESYSFSNPKFLSFCLQHGIGAVVFNNPLAAEKADFENFENGSFHAVTFGQIASFDRYGDFLGDPKDIYEIQHSKVHPLIQQQEEWHGAIIPPEQGYLPASIRSHLKVYIETITDKMRVPRVAMKVDPKQTKQGKPSRVLTFNFCVEDFEHGEEEAEAFVECVQWYLPPSMSVSLLQSRQLLDRAENDPDSPFIPIDADDQYTVIE